jgi:hypothetical protein
MIQIVTKYAIGFNVACHAYLAGAGWHCSPLLKHLGHLNNFCPKVISNLSDVRTIARYRR